MEKRLKKKLIRADSLIVGHKHIEAILFLKEIIKEFPHSGDAYYLLGCARERCGLFNLAKRSYERARELGFNNLDLLKNFGWLKIAMGKVEEGRNDLRNAINLNLMDSEPYLDLAVSYFNYLDFKEGFAWLDRAQALKPDDDLIEDTRKFWKEAMNDFLKLSKSDQEKARKAQCSLERRQEEQLNIIKHNFVKEGFTDKEIGELKEELELGGLSEKMLIYKDDVEKIISYKSEKDIEKRKKEIEKELLNLIDNYKANISIDEIKEIIYMEESHDDIEKIINKFELGRDLEEDKKILYLLNDAWNHFPHKALGGISPTEKIFELQKEL